MTRIVINTKGGVGKSTVSSQLLTAYSYIGGVNSIAYAEIDDENQNIKNLKESTIINATLINTEMISTFIKDLMLSDADIIVDVGGNKTAKLTLEKIKDIGGFYSDVIYYIPMLDSLQDKDNAMDTYNLIREIDQDNKIIFVLNKAYNKFNQELTKEQFLFYYGLESLFIKAVELDEQCHTISLNANNIYNITGYLQKTVAEIAESNIDNDVKEAIIASKKDPSLKQNALKLLYLKEIIQKARNLMKDEYMPLFEELKTIEGIK